MSEIELEGVRIHYTQCGRGPDIVWLAGGDQRGSSWHDFQTPAFGDFRNTTYDARGVGETECDLPRPWSIADYAVDCAHLIERVCRPPVALVGLSMGSLIAQQVSLDRPDLVRVAVCMGTYARANAYVREWERAEVAFRDMGGTLTPEFALAHYAVLMYPNEVLGDDALWERVRPIVARDYGTRDGAGLAAQWHACVEFDSLDRLPACEPPIHVVAFTHDVQTPPSLGRQVAETAADGHFHLLDGLGHCSCFGHRPDEVNRLIRDVVGPYLRDGVA